MAKLTQIIGGQSYELIRDRIGEILADELSNQFTLSNNPEMDVNVFVERSSPFDKSEFPAVNIFFSGGDFSLSTPNHDDAEYEYYIDVYTSGKNTNTDRGDKLSSQKLHKLIGVCRSILRTPYYLTLGFTIPSVGHSSISSIQIMEPKNNQDAISTTMGRLIFKVKASESVEIQEAVNITDWKTQVKLNLTEKGYLYQKN